MTSREFVYWLQGFFELREDGAPLTTKQTEAIRRHLSMVFVHEIDPSAGPHEHQVKLDAAHAHGAPTRPPSAIDHVTVRC